MTAVILYEEAVLVVAGGGACWYRGKERHWFYGGASVGVGSSR